MREWSKINKTSILNDRGLLLEFSRDFLNAFKKPLNVGCKMCINDAYKRLINFKSSVKMEVKKKTEYILRKCFVGSLTWKGSYIFNETLTDKVAKDLVKNHPHGAKLFDFIPKAVKKVVKTKDIKEESNE